MTRRITTDLRIGPNRVLLHQDADLPGIAVLEIMPGLYIPCYLKDKVVRVIRSPNDSRFIMTTPSVDGWFTLHTPPKEQE